MDQEKLDQLCINTIRMLAVDGVEKSKSGHPGMPMGDAAMAGDPQSSGRVVAFLGAGIYEELLFRLMMLPAVAVLLSFCGMKRNTSFALAVLTTSLLFAAAHYRLDITLGPIQWATPSGDPFEWMSFVFRLMAGSFFSIVFLYRGFGIAVGAHAMYDILVYFL